MTPSSNLDDPGSVSEFLRKMRKFRQNAAENATQEMRSTLNPEIPAFSHQDLPTDSKSKPMHLVQNENGFFTEVETLPAAPAPDPVLIAPALKTTGSAPRPRPMTPTQHRLLVGKKAGVEHLTEKSLAELTAGYMENVVTSFRNNHHPDTLQGGGNAIERKPPAVEPSSSSDTTDSIPFPKLKVTPNNDSIEKTKAELTITGEIAEKQAALGEKSVVVPDSARMPALDGRLVASQNALGALTFLEDTPTSKSVSSMRLSDDESKATSPTTRGVVHEESISATMAGGAEDIATGRHHSPTIVNASSGETDGNGKGETIEDRENLTRFKTWGTPNARNKPQSRQRTVILSGLPQVCDLTFAQSLIHGGAIESINLVVGTKAVATAYVTFVSADDCDKYYDKYPNGFDVRQQGKKWSVIVYKRDGVDVVSGMLQGYLECGATRAVKVSNVDEDWGIVALNKLAEGRKNDRKVEAVLDTYHNGTRTVTFRFANIAAAVQFKGILIRSDEWEGSFVEFAEDPCARATGFRTS